MELNVTNKEFSTQFSNVSSLIRDRNISLDIGDTTEFQFAFRGKSTWNYTLEANNFDLLTVKGTAVSVFPFATVT